MGIKVHCLITTLLLFTPVLAQDLITFDDQGWNSDQSLEPNFTISNFVYSSNKNFYTNYGCNFDVYGVSIYFVFQNPAEDQFTITSADNNFFNLKSIAAYQVSELSTDNLLIEGWNGSIIEYSTTFSNITTWQILDLSYYNIDKAVIKLDPSGSGSLTDFNFDDFLLEDPFPVELTSFTATVNDNQVFLKWITETEVDNYGFEIQRTMFNAQSSTWETLGFVEGYGNSNSTKEYSFIDNNPAGGSIFLYRLKQLDNDGTYEYSDEIEVKLIPAEFALSQNYPNPFNPSTTISYTIPKEELVLLILYNAIGEEIAILKNEVEPIGNHELKFDASHYPSGTYFYTLQTENFVETKKMVLLK